MRSNIRSTLQEHGQNLLVCHCKSSKVLHGSYGPPSGQLHSPSASTIISPVYAASQVRRKRPNMCPSNHLTPSCSIRRFPSQNRKSRFTAQFSLSFPAVNMSGLCPNQNIYFASSSRIVINVLSSFRPDPNADTLEQHDLVSIDLVDKRPLDSAGGAAARPPSPSGILISKYGN